MCSLDPQQQGAKCLVPCTCCPLAYLHLASASTHTAEHAQFWWPRPAYTTATGASKPWVWPANLSCVCLCPAAAPGDRYEVRVKYFHPMHFDTLNGRYVLDLPTVVPKVSRAAVSRGGGNTFLAAARPGLHSKQEAAPLARPAI